MVQWIDLNLKEFLQKKCLQHCSSEKKVLYKPI